MRYRIDYRWILTTSVVVGVAGAGTAAIMRQGGTFDAAPMSSSAEALSLKSTVRAGAQIEPARLSHESGTSGADLAAFESQALPPVFAFTTDRGRTGEAERIREAFAPAWSARARQFAAGFDSSGGQRNGAGYGGGLGLPGGSSGGGAHAVQTPANGPAATSRSSGRPGAGNSQSPGVAPRPRPNPTAPGAPSAPGSPITGPVNPSGPATPTEPGVPIAIPMPPAGPGAPPIETGPAPGDDPPITGPGSVSPTPEPVSLILIGTGIAGMFGALRRRLI